jgi:hypothetical protein
MTWNLTSATVELHGYLSVCSSISYEADLHHDLTSSLSRTSSIGLIQTALTVSFSFKTRRHGLLSQAGTSLSMLSTLVVFKEMDK